MGNQDDIINVDSILSLMGGTIFHFIVGIKVTCFWDEDVQLLSESVWISITFLLRRLCGEMSHRTSHHIWSSLIQLSRITKHCTYTLQYSLGNQFACIKVASWRRRLVLEWLATLELRWYHRGLTSHLIASPFRVWWCVRWASMFTIHAYYFDIPFILIDFCYGIISGYRGRRDWPFV